MHDLARLGGAVDATVGAGANEVNSISFGLNDPTAEENVAREKAVQALQAKADLYARATGYRVQRLVSLSEGGVYAVSPPMPVASFARSGLGGSPSRVSAGELNVRINVSGVYELAR
jgi:uncharacterized protein YggE